MIVSHLDWSSDNIFGHLLRITYEEPGLFQLTQLQIPKKLHTFISALYMASDVHKYDNSEILLIVSLMTVLQTYIFVFEDVDELEKADHGHIYNVW